MKNFLYFTTVSGTIWHVEFDRIEYIKPIHIHGAGTNDYRYYSINITNVVYTDTGETDKDAQFVLFAPDDYVTYLEKTYKFEDLDRLRMVVENEKLKHVLDEL